MNGKYFGETGMLVSELYLGTMTFRRETDEKTAIAIIDRFEKYEDSWNKRGTEQNFHILDEIKKIAEKNRKSYSQIALSWIRSKSEITAPIVGARTMDQLEDNLGCIGWNLTKGEIEALDEISSIEVPYPYGFIKKFSI